MTTCGLSTYDYDERVASFLPELVAQLRLQVKEKLVCSLVAKSVPMLFMSVCL